MSYDLIIVLSLLSICVVLFILNKPRMDVVALLAIVALPLSGVIDVSEALSGFADPSVVLIALLFVIGDGLVRTGVAYRMGDMLVHHAGNSETRLLIVLMFSVALLGSVMSSTGVVAIFIPVVLSVAARMRVPPGRLLMPLSFAGLMSGMLTLVATPPNMVVDSALKREGYDGFHFFSFTPIGVVILIMGVGYMLVARRWLTVRTPEENASAKGRRNFQSFIEDYALAGHGFRLRVLPDTPLVGKPLLELSLRDKHHINVVAVERQSRFGSELHQPNSATTLNVGDVLLVDSGGVEIDLQTLCDTLRVEPLPLKGSYFIDPSREVGMAEIALPPESALLGKSVLDSEFRRQYGLNVIGVRRKRKALGHFLEEKLSLGDMILVAGPWKSIRKLQSRPQDFMVLSLPAEIDDVAPARKQAPFALLSLGVMIALMVSGLVPNVLAALIACLLMGAFRCVDMNSAYKSIHWQSLILIAGMIPFAMSLERTGGVELAVDGLMGLFEGAGPRVLLGSLFVLTAATGLFISNTATAVLMAPIALSMAKHLEVSPLPFAMTVALAASAAFMTPVSSPVNTLVLGPGQYRFSDFIKIGVPFTFLVLIVSVWLVPIFFPL